jgi:hypothetical protein
MLPLLQFLRLAFLSRDALWEALVITFSDHPSPTYTPVVLIFQDETEVMARQLVYSVPHARP